MTRLPDTAHPLSRDDAAQAFAAILDGTVSDETIAEFLIALSERGETAIEIAAAAQALAELDRLLAAGPYPAERAHDLYQESSGIVRGYVERLDPE